MIVLLVVGGALAVWRIANKLTELHLSMNSRLDELLTTTRALARAEGFKAGQENHLRAIRDFHEPE